MALKSDTKFGESTCCFKIDMRNLTNSDQSTQVAKIFTLMGSFWTKYILFELKKYRRVVFNDTDEEWCKIWRKTSLWFGKWHGEFGKFSPDHLKVSKLGLSWDPIVQRRKCLSLKFTAKLCVMTTKNGAKFKEELTGHFKILTLKLLTLTILTLTLWKSKKYAL